MPYIADQVPLNAHQCLVRAATDYALPVRAMLAVLYTEGGSVGTIRQNRNLTSDHGPFQINTVWTRHLTARFGITSDMLTHDFCWSTRAAAYILRYEINMAKGDFWEGVGRYHSRTPGKKAAYIQKVYNNSLRF